jgi:hypothetical protein
MFYIHISYEPSVTQTVLAVVAQKRRLTGGDPVQAKMDEEKRIYR